MYLPTYLPTTLALSPPPLVTPRIVTILYRALARECANPDDGGGEGGLACRKTIVVTVTVISNGVEIAITTGTYVGYTVYRTYVHTCAVLSVNVPFHYAG